MTDLELDKAPTSKGKCYLCRETILIGTPRCWWYDRMKKEINKIQGMNVKRLLCQDCALHSLNYEIQSHKRDLSKNLKMRRKLKRMAKGKKAIAMIERAKMLKNIMEKEKENGR